MLGAAEHHVFEEMSEAGLAGLNLVPRSGLDRDLQGYQVREAGWHDDHAQPVRKRDLRRLERQDVGVTLTGMGHGVSPGTALALARCGIGAARNIAPGRHIG
jgi:hypothetical protein